MAALLNIPLQPVPNQELTVHLNNQRTRIRLLSRLGYDYLDGTFNSFPALYMDIYVADALLIGGALCRCRMPVIRGKYLGFIGEFYWFDARAEADPQSYGLGSRWFLGYEDPTQ